MSDSEQLFKCVISNIKWDRDQLMKPNSVAEAMATGYLVVKADLPKTVRFWTTMEEYNDRDFIEMMLEEKYGVAVKCFSVEFDELKNGRMLSKVKGTWAGHFYME